MYKIPINETSREQHRGRSRWWGLLTIPPKIVYENNVMLH